MVTAINIASRNIERLRAAKGFTQADLAKMAGISLRTMSAIESGEHWYELSNVDAVARALGVPLWVVFYDKEAAPLPPTEAIEVLKDTVIDYLRLKSKS